MSAYFNNLFQEFWSPEHEPILTNFWSPNSDPNSEFRILKPISRILRPKRGTIFTILEAQMLVHFDRLFQEFWSPKRGLILFDFVVQRLTNLDNKFQELLSSNRRPIWQCWPILTTYFQNSWVLDENLFWQLWNSNADSFDNLWKPSVGSFWKFIFKICRAPNVNLF